MSAYACCFLATWRRPWSLVMVIGMLVVIWTAPAKADVIIDNVISYTPIILGCEDGMGRGCAAFGLNGVSGPFQASIEIRESLLRETFELTGRAEIIGLPANDRAIIDFSAVIGDAVFTRKDIIGTIDISSDYTPFGPFEDLGLVLTAVLVDGTTFVSSFFSDITVTRGTDSAGCIADCPWIVSYIEPRPFPVPEPAPVLLMLPVVAIFGLAVASRLRLMPSRG